MFDLRFEELSEKKETQKDEDLLESRGGDAIYIKSTPKNMTLVKKADLELAYRTDPICFNSVNLYAQTAMHAGSKFISYEGKNCGDSIEFLDTFFNNLGDYGLKLDKNEFTDTMFRFLCIWGNFYAEKIFNKDGNIVDLNVLDPKKVDYARDSSNNILFDKHNNPIGYTVTYDYGTTDKEIIQKVKIPKEVSLPTNSLYIPTKNICHLKLYTYGDSLEGIGIIEPGYLDSKYKLNIEKSFANLTLKYANPKMKIKVGDQTHEPTPTQLKNALSSVANINQNTEFSLPYWVDIDILQAKQPDQVANILQYYISQQIASTGVPSAYSTGGGDATNRSTLNRQEYMMKLRLKDILRRISMTFEKQILNPILETNDRAEYKNCVKLHWGEISTEDLDSKAKRLVQYFSMGLITKSRDLEEYIRQIEELPVIGGNIDE